MKVYREIIPVLMIYALSNKSVATAPPGILLEPGPLLDIFCDGIEIHLLGSFPVMFELSKSKIILKLKAIFFIGTGSHHVP